MLGRVHRWRLAAPPGVALVLAAGLGWLGCGGSSDSPSSPTTPTPPPTTNACSAVSGGASSGLAILNGTECSTSNTSIVLLNIRTTDGSGGQCSGTVIGARSVLTAAHCLDGTIQSILVYPGTGNQIPASSFQAHPRYSSTGGAAYDVAVVTTSDDIGRPVIPLLTSRDPRAGETTVLGGWGKDQNGNGTILRAGLNTVSAVNALYFETQYSTSTASVCYGDSGGSGLLAEGGSWAVGGVTSETSASGYNCTKSTSYFAGIRASDVKSFILGLVSDAVQR
jgi:hypothetical protein